jgi:hypothetical protein
MGAEEFRKIAETVGSEAAHQEAVTVASGAAHREAVTVASGAAHREAVTLGFEVAHREAVTLGFEVAHQEAVTRLVLLHLSVGSVRRRLPLSPIRARRSGSWSQTKEVLPALDSALFWRTVTSPGAKCDKWYSGQGVRAWPVHFKLQGTAVGYL